MSSTVNQNATSPSQTMANYLEPAAFQTGHPTANEIQDAARFYHAAFMEARTNSDRAQGYISDQPVTDGPRWNSSYALNLGKIPRLNYGNTYLDKAKTDDNLIFAPIAAYGTFDYSTGLSVIPETRFATNGNHRYSVRDFGAPLTPDNQNAATLVNFMRNAPGEILPQTSRLLYGG
jgi:hypothetical protein